MFIKYIVSEAIDWWENNRPIDEEDDNNSDTEDSDTKEKGTTPAPPSSAPPSSAPPSSAPPSDEVKQTTKFHEDHTRVFYVLKGEDKDVVVTNKKLNKTAPHDQQYTAQEALDWLNGKHNNNDIVPNGVTVYLIPNITVNAAPTNATHLSYQHVSWYRKINEDTKKAAEKYKALSDSDKETYRQIATFVLSLKGEYK